MGSPSSSAARNPRQNWSLRYIEVQEAYDKRVHAALQDALDQVERAVAALERRVGVGAAVQRAQMAQTRVTLLEILEKIFVQLGGIVRKGSQDSAEAAKEAMLASEQPLIQAIFPTPAQLEAFRQGEIKRARRNIQSTITRVLSTERKLSQRLYSSKALAKGQLNRTINAHLARGSSAAQMSKDIRQFVNPNSPGGVSYISKRLARTEINNAFHAQGIADMQDRPWVNQAYWKLSKSHPVRQPPDQCDTYARVELFPADKIPAKPHPNCLCYVIPKLMDEKEFRNALLSGQFQDWTERN